MTKIGDSTESEKLDENRVRIPWFTALIVGLGLWAFFGFIPLALVQVNAVMGLVGVSDMPVVGTVGDMFGSANAFFSGMALIAIAITLRQQAEGLGMQKQELRLTRDELALTRKELSESAEAQTKMADLQAKAISLQVILPLFDEISSEDWRGAAIAVSDFKRRYGPDRFSDTFEHLLQKRQEGSLSEGEERELTEVDLGRRKMAMSLQKLHRLSKTDVVDDDLARLVMGPDLADLYIVTVEPLEAAVRQNYNRDPYDFARRLFSESERMENGRY